MKRKEQLIEFRAIRTENHKKFAYSPVRWIILLLVIMLCFSMAVQAYGFVTASMSANAVAKGDTAYIRGTATETDSVKVWIMKNSYDPQYPVNVPVASDDSYSYELTEYFTQYHPTGQYFVFVQHPGANGRYCTRTFPQGAAVDDITTGLSSCDDDTYTKLSFMMEDPWIRLEAPPSDIMGGDYLSATGTTNLAEGDVIELAILSSGVPVSTGSAVVQMGDTYNTFSTTLGTSNLNTGTYLLRAEGKGAAASAPFTVHSLDVQGVVTITYEGRGTYYVGETIRLTGTNTESDMVYLFLVGPGLAANGVSLADIAVNSQDNTPATFRSVAVSGDSTWSSSWDTARLGRTLEGGTYTIYAAAAPYAKGNLGTTPYATASVVLKKPFTTASVSTNSVARGDSASIRGTAEQAFSIRIWIIGDQYDPQYVVTVPVQQDRTYSYELTGHYSLSHPAGRYYVLVQDPGSDGRFYTGSFSTASTAQGITDAISSGSDDLVTRLSFMLEDAWIRISSPSVITPGHSLSVAGTTNLAEGDTVTLTIEPDGVSGVTSVVKGDTYNSFSGTLDTTSLNYGEHRITAGNQPTLTSATATFMVQNPSAGAAPQYAYAAPGSQYTPDDRSPLFFLGIFMFCLVVLAVGYFVLKPVLRKKASPSSPPPPVQPAPPEDVPQQSVPQRNLKPVPREVPPAGKPVNTPRAGSPKYDELEQLHVLFQKGIITRDDYEAKKREILGLK